MAIPNEQHNGLFIELKRGKNKPTDKQNEIIEPEKIRLSVQVINNFDDFRATVNDSPEEALNNLLIIYKRTHY